MGNLIQLSQYADTREKGGVVMPEGEPVLNCLRCRHCRLDKTTDFAVLNQNPGAIVRIHCNRLDRVIPARLLEEDDCPMTDRVDGTKPKRSARKRGERNRGGDLTAHAFVVEKAFLLACYHALPLRLLVRLTGRPSNSLYQICVRKMGMQPRPRADFEEERRHRNMVSARKRNGSYVNDEQERWILERYQEGFWPSVGGSHRGESAQKRKEIQKALEAGVAERGKFIPWRYISNWMHRRHSPAYVRKRLENKNRSHHAATHAAIPAGIHRGTGKQSCQATSDAVDAGETRDRHTALARQE